MRKKTLYIGDSRKEFNRIRDVLEFNKIHYKYTTINHEKSTLLLGRGTARSFGWNFGDEKNIYEILVAENEYENAMYLIRNSVKNNHD